MLFAIFSDNESEQEELKRLAIQQGATSFEYRNPKRFRSNTELAISFQSAIFATIYTDLFDYLKKKGVKVHLRQSEFISIENILEKAKPIRKKK